MLYREIDWVTRELLAMDLLESKQVLGRRPELQDLIRRALESLPEPIVRRNPTLSNPFVRGKVYELACGEPLS